MASSNIWTHFCSSTLIVLLLPLLLQFHSGKSELQFNYYAQGCPRAEEIIKEQVIKLYNKHRNTAVSWVRNLFHVCIVKSCDASLLLETVNGIESEKASQRSLGMRNFKYVNTIKAAVESECPVTVSCADIVALSARDGIVMLGGPRVEMKTGRRDSTVSYGAVVEDFIPNHNDSISLVLSRFQSIGVDVEGTVALLASFVLFLPGSHSVGRVHCVNLVHRIYPTVDPSMDPDYAEYLKGRCPPPDPDPQAVLYARNDRETPMILDSYYYKNLLGHKGLLMVDQQLTSDPLTSPYVEKMAADNGFFHDQVSRAVVLWSENNPLTGNQGEIRKDCRYVNSN
uniref:Peroxidase n=1 Tax=Populus tomentosa TaxID=118781 RepID=V9PBI4_POPTO|nr:POD21 [Populus tomentosa]